MSEISPIYTSTMKKQRYGPTKPWHFSNSPKLNTTKRTPIPRYETQQALDLPETEGGIRFIPPKPFNTPDERWEPIHDWWTMCASIMGRRVWAPIGLPVYGSTRKISDAIDAARQERMVSGKQAPWQAHYSEYIAKLEADHKAAKSNEKNSDRGSDPISNIQGPYCLLTAKPQPRIWKR